MSVNYTYADWARELAMTPQERFSVGPTDTYVPAAQYYATIVPLFINQVPDGYGRLPVPRNIYVRLIRGGVLETNQSVGFSIGSNRYFVKDSASNRNRLKEMAALPLHRDRYIYLNTNLLTISCGEAWANIVLQLYNLQRRLKMIGWETMIDKRGLVDLSGWLKLGRLIDTGKLPVTLVNTALYLASARLLDWLRENHPSKGVFGKKPIRFVYKNTLYLGHVNDKRREVLYVIPAKRPGSAMVVSFNDRKPKGKRN